tara:strand:- start:2883 stop:3188 length:306 start_codon:yes stop_codon:yes gene_type:complete
MAKADSPVTSRAKKESLGAEMKLKYALAKDVDQIVKDLQFFYIKATATSTTTDFGNLKVGDLVIQIPDSAGNSHYMTVATAGTLPEAAVVDDLYVVLRPSA